MAQDCPFCSPAADRIFYVGQLVLGLWDRYPASPGHALVITKRHVESWFDATNDERAELVSATEIARQQVERDHSPDGFNLGVNVGEAAGQTVPHLHLHIIPRYRGDVADPRGGIRFVIPSRANYLGEGQMALHDAQPRPTWRTGAFQAPSLVTGENEPLLPQLCAHLQHAVAADWAVAFLRSSGFRLLREHCVDMLERGGRFRLITGTYLGVTEPEALGELLDLEERYPGQVSVHAFEAHSGGQLVSFHPKAYLFEQSDGSGVAWIGSSNLTHTALRGGVEWNYRLITQRDPLGLDAARRAFLRLLAHDRVCRVDAAWIREYQARRAPDPKRAGVEEEPPPDPPTPHCVQAEALKKLEETRRLGNRAGLVVLATGLGKTWLSAFDSAQPAFGRILFVAHREEILAQALSTFRRIRPRASLGLYNGEEKTPDAEVVFASIQTLGKQRHLDQFERQSFDYIVVDEFHHAAARTYRRLIDHFDPKFLLGLTATPERTDGGDLLSLCGENLVFRCDLAEGIRRGLLAPFHYFGVPDEVDYSNIPWRSSRFDEEALTQAVATQARAQNALDQFRERGGTRTLGFCCSKRHADFMRSFFEERGVRVAAVHSGAGSDPRALSLEQLGRGELDIVFAVDMLNEGVDLPNIDTVMMLRPTESRILWLQQLGRGLRIAQGKSHLTVIDYIGNHRTFLLKPQTLFDLPPGDAAIERTLQLLQRGDVDLPPGCEVVYDLETVDILRGLLRKAADADVLRFAYEDFRQRYGVRPAATEMHHEGHSLQKLRTAYGSWHGFVDEMGDLSSSEQALIRNGRGAAFLRELEKTPMTRSYKMLVLLGMLAAGRFPGSIHIDELARHVERLARRTATLRNNLGDALGNPLELRRLLETNPIKAWCGGKGTSGTPYFSYENGVFRSEFHVAPEDNEPFSELVREIADWRLAAYLDRPARQPDAAVPVTLSRPEGLHVGARYMREEIPPIFGLEFQGNLWRQGYLARAGHIFLLVTLEKANMPEAHRYGDRFLARDLFEWQSQNRHSQSSKAGREMRHHEEQGVPVHLFVRKRGKLGSKAAPFIYCGPLKFVDWEGNNPITIRWRLDLPLSASLAELFGLSER